MSKFVFEKQYTADYNLEKVDCHFNDDLCGELDCSLDNEMTIERADTEDYLHNILTMENGIKIDYQIYLNEEKQEWFCIAEEI